MAFSLAAAATAATGVRLAPFGCSLSRSPALGGGTLPSASQSEGGRQTQRQLSAKAS